MPPAKEGHIWVLSDPRICTAEPEEHSTNTVQLQQAILENVPSVEVGFLKQLQHSIRLISGGAVYE
uniref:Uncharacterized protein n=1 Tax=Tetraselmis sp. GSL018 TaxID=582737 RepID=A0A061QLQ0_9CHLO